MAGRRETKEVREIEEPVPERDVLTGYTPGGGMFPKIGIIRIGISGWTYSPWRGHFYPEGLRQSEELAYAASRFPSLEVNGTFYGL